ncbi:hypothetical protein HRM2_21840 [Desulforapulum autotrophicum HRM2]|uniref:DUF2868 domain-containing protein n=1 Tax=Desulforapulum autotrophicum (strain ATCC 43914 / DSM 3382 / VKM B-1955 / HRM2) TaxID=177437 RepID=C0QDL8_DESAH|nr:DUF2868 domain-containing protein [Desulforapulum autotrophicum]ACN15282.1 hypothetical protein HRM2_21840 [Desulforapulum autotrophicum HRM2]
MKKKWTIGDVIDLEYLLGQDSRIEDEKILAERDRRLYLEKIGPLVAQTRPLPRTLVRLWLFFMGQNTGTLPGVLVDGGFRLLRGGFLVGGVMTGFLACLSLFSYTGRMPLNISYFFGVILVPQTLLLFLTLAGLLVMVVRPDKGVGFGIYPVLGLAVERALIRLFQKTLGRLSRMKQDALMSALGSFRRSRRAHGHLFLWPLFVLMQIFGVGFNLGALGATLGRVAFFDTAFGWQSTLNLSADFVHRVVSMVALPWSWAVPEGVGFPSAEQIQGTRLILKDGIYDLATSDLVSWWPFLCLTVVFYALLPRILLLVMGGMVQGRCLKQYSFDGWAVQKLVRRLVTPRVTMAPADDPELRTSGGGHGHPRGAMASADSQVSRLEFDREVPQDSDRVPIMNKDRGLDGDIPLTPGNQEMPEPFLALVHDDIFDVCNTEEFKEKVQDRLNRSVDTILRFGLDTNAEVAAIISVADCVAGIVMLQEAWMPPIREILNFIVKVRAGGERIPLVVVLIGKPGPDNLFTVPDSQDRKIWTMKINGLGDPLIHVEDLVQP